MTEQRKVEFKAIFKDELEKSLETLKKDGKQILKEELEDIARELSDMYARIAVRTPGKTDDFFLLIKSALDDKIDNIDGKEG